MRNSDVLCRILTRVENERAELLSFIQRNVVTEILDNRRRVAEIARQHSNAEILAEISKAAALERELFAIAKRQADEREKTYDEIAFLDEEIEELRRRLFLLEKENF